MFFCRSLSLSLCSHSLKFTNIFIAFLFIKIVSHWSVWQARRIIAKKFQKRVQNYTIEINECVNVCASEQATNDVVLFDTFRVFTSRQWQCVSSYFLFHWEAKRYNRFSFEQCGMLHPILLWLPIASASYNLNAEHG